MPQINRPDYASQPNPMQVALEHVINSIRNGGQAAPTWGFHEPTVTAGAAMGPVLDATGSALADPRNAWMGLGPLAMAKWAQPGKGMGAWNDFLLRELRKAPDTGGFNIPTSKMLRDDPTILRGPGVPEEVKRGDYLFGRQVENKSAAAAQNPDSAHHEEALSKLQKSSPFGYRQLVRTMLGQAELQGEKTKQRNPLLGGSIPPEWFRPKP